VISRVVQVTGFQNRIFISYAAQQRAVAENLALALRGRGHDVFLDKDELPPGRTFDQQIKRAVDGSDLFIFLISPQSVTPGCYALTELAFAREKWNSPYNRVLPVMIDETDLAAVPAYLKAVTLLRPQGNVAAEVGAVVDTLLSANPVLSRVFITAALIGAASGMASAYTYTIGSNIISLPVNYFALLPGVIFGIAVEIILFLWGGRSRSSFWDAYPIVLVSWLLVIGIVLSMGQPLKEPTPLSWLQLPLPRPAPNDFDALQWDIQFKMVLSAIVGSFGTWLGVALVTPRVRTWFGFGLVLLAGLLPVFLLTSGTFSQNLNISALLILWQASVLTALAYSLCTGASLAHIAHAESAST
jgi:hypothetical protein